MLCLVKFHRYRTNYAKRKNKPSTHFQSGTAFNTLYWTSKVVSRGVGCICETLHYFLSNRHKSFNYMHVPQKYPQVSGAYAKHYTIPVKSSHVVQLHACTAEVLFILVMRVLVMVCVCKNVHIRRNEVLEHITASSRICQRIDAPEYAHPSSPRTGACQHILSVATPVRSLS